MNLRILIAWLSLFVTQCVLAGEVHLAVAANFSGPIQKIVPAFEKETGHKVIVSIGATGKFYAQVTNGAPFDVFLSADDETPAKLEQAFYAVAGTRVTYAIGKLVLWSAKGGVVDHNGDVLSKGDFQHLAIANPKTAPYGAAAVETMKRLKVWALIEPKLVRGENIAQTHQFVQTGNAELGFVALSQVITEGKIAVGSGWIVPPSYYAPIRQDAVLLAKARHNPAASDFLTFLKGDKSKSVIRSFGYELP